MAYQQLLSNNPQTNSPDFYRKSYATFLKENYLSQLERYNYFILINYSISFN